jgi:hypothetical protein
MIKANCIGRTKGSLRSKKKSQYRHRLYEHRAILRIVGRD